MPPGVQLRQRAGRRRERPVRRADLAEPAAEVVVHVPGEAAQRVHDEAGEAERHGGGRRGGAEVAARPDEQDGGHHHEEHALRGEWDTVVQGDQSGCSLGVVDNKTKVAF